MMEVISIVNQKGGVGKTTTATCLAVRLNQLGKKTLLIDTDPQCNATDTYRAKSVDVNTLYDVLVDGGKLSDSIQHTDQGDIVAADRLLIEAEAKIVGIGRESLLTIALEEVKEDYDYVVIDCPPNFGILSNNALLASNKVIVPVTASRFAIMGLADINKTIQQVRKFTQNKSIKISGLLLVRVNKNQTLTKDFIDQMPDVCTQLNTKFYKTKIRNAVSVEKSQMNRVNLFEWEKMAKGHELDGAIGIASDYREFVDEFIIDEKDDRGAING